MFFYLFLLFLLGMVITTIRFFYRPSKKGFFAMLFFWIAGLLWMFKPEYFFMFFGIAGLLNILYVANWAMDDRILIAMVGFWMKIRDRFNSNKVVVFLKGIIKKIRGK